MSNPWKPREDAQRDRSRAPILGEHRTPPEYYELAERYGITIQDDWIKDLEAAYGVKF